MPLSRRIDAFDKPVHPWSMKIVFHLLIFSLMALFVAAQPAVPPKPESPAQIAARQTFEAAKTAAEAGDAVKLRELADLYYAGKGVTKNLGEAYKQYLASAEKGDVLSEATVGWMLRNGQGVARDYKKCLGWYTKAAEKGHVESQLGLAELYYNSVGLEKRDYATAYKWFLIASGLGSKEAKAFIPRMEQAVLKEPNVNAEQKATAEKAANDWLAAYGKK